MKHSQLMRRRPLPLHRGLLVWLAAGLFLAPAGAAQDALPGVFGEVIDVRVINLEVVVTDGDGGRVTGLQAKDFLLEVDGREVPIGYFTEILGGKAVSRAEIGEQEGAGVPQLTPGAPVGNSYLLFIDDYFSIARDRDSVLGGLIEDLPLLGPEDRMAVVAYDGRRLTMLTSWSGNQGQLVAALEAAQERPAYGLQRISERRSSLGAPEARDIVGRRAADRFDRTGILDIDEETYAEQLTEQVEGTLSAAIATLRSFASPPGRKIMMLVSGGWPFTPATYTTGDSQRLVYDQDLMGGANLFRSLSDTANRLGYTLYPVDVPGLQTQGLDDASDSGPVAGLRRDFVREQEVHAALHFLAEETGGQAFLDSVRREMLPRIYADTRSYYWLGFTPDWAGDDEVHDIRIRLRDGKLKVRSREGFQDLSRRSEVSMMVESALLFGNSPSNLPLVLEVGRSHKAGRSKSRLPLTVYIPVDHVTILPDNSTDPVRYVARLELRLAAIDTDGRRSDIPVIPLEVSGPQAPEEGRFLRYTTEVTLRRTRQDLIVSIYDPVSGNLLSATQELDLKRRP